MQMNVGSTFLSVEQDVLLDICFLFICSLHMKASLIRVICLKVFQLILSATRLSCTNLQSAQKCVIFLQSEAQAYLNL